MTVYCVFEHYGEGGCDVCPAALVAVYTDEEEAKKHAQEYGCYYKPWETKAKYGIEKI